MNESEDYVFRRKTKIKFYEKHLERCYNMKDTERNSEGNSTEGYSSTFKLCLGLLVGSFTRIGFTILRVPLMILLGGLLVLSLNVMKHTSSQSLPSQSIQKYIK